MFQNLLQVSGLVRIVLTEPGAGSDAKETKAVLSEDGKYYTITGQKKVSNAGFCSVFIVFCSYWR
jgi:alkylation response protein AidB-like acyl-CoA dehydrogenase